MSLDFAISAVFDRSSGRSARPPRITQASLGDAVAYSRVVTLKLRADDGGGEHGPADPETAQSGLSEIAISFDDSFAGAAWQPYQADTQIWLPTASPTGTRLFVRVRDAAGNVSDVSRVEIQRGQPRHDADRAVLLEEQALEALRAGNAQLAKNLVHQSLAPLERTVIALLPRCQPGGNSVDRDLRQRFIGVLAKKVVVEGLLLLRKKADAERLLVEALADERQAIATAALSGRTL